MGVGGDSALYDIHKLVVKPELERRSLFGNNFRVMLGGLVLDKRKRRRKMNHKQKKISLCECEWNCVMLELESLAKYFHNQKDKDFNKWGTLLTNITRKMKKQWQQKK